MKNLLNVLKVSDLKVVAKELAVKGYSKAKKAELVEMIDNVVPSLKSIVSENHDITRYTSKEEIVKELNHKYSFVSFTQQLDEYTPHELINIDNFDMIDGIPASPIIANKFALNKEHAFGVNLDMSYYDYCTAFNIDEDANVFVVNNNATLNLLKLITNNNIDSARTMFDALYVDLNGFQKLILFNLDVISDMHYDIDLTDLNDRVVKLDRNTISKRSMFSIYKFNAVNMHYDDNFDTFVLNDNTDVKPVKIGENSLFRAYNEFDEEGKPSVNHFVIISTASLYDDDTLTDDQAKATVKKLLLNGFIFNDKHYKVMLQSASQSRQGKFLFTDLEDIDNVIDKLMFGGYKRLIAKKNIAKGSSRVGLITTTTKDVGIGYTFATPIDNDKLAVEAEREVYVMINKGTKKEPKYAIVKKNKVIKTEVCDGQGTMSLLCANKVSMKLGLISAPDYLFFKNHVSAVRDVKEMVDKIDRTDDEERVIRIFNKIPKAYQIRHGSADKGLLVVFDHDLYGYKEDIVLTSSMRKEGADEADENMPLLIASWQKPLKDKAFMNYQFWNSLDLKDDDIRDIAESLLKENIDNGILVDANKALKFLGLISNIGDEDKDDKKLLVSKITRVLTIEPEMIKDRKIIEGIKSLIAEFLKQMKFGRIPVDGSFCYFLTDPKYMFGDKALNAGEYYFNNTIDTYAVFRSPLIYRGEALKLNTIEHNDYWYLKDIIIFNAFDDSLQRAGGANL